MKQNKESSRPIPLTVDACAKRSLADQLQFLCHLAHLAPSSHNSQPWRFFIDEKNGSIDIYLDKKFILPASDVAGRQAAVSMGCAIENITIAASFLHAPPRIDIIPQKKKLLLPQSAYHTEERKSHYIFLARFHYGTKINPALSLENLYKSIFSRKVMRAEFDPHKPLSPAIIQQLQTATDGEKTKLHSITDTIRRLSIAEFQGQADGFVINSPRFSKELGQWLLPNDTESLLGMPGIGFGLDDAEAKRIHHGLAGNGALQPEDTLKFAAAGKFGIEKSPFLGCITIPKDDVFYWIEAGRLLERIFLILESNHISVAIHAGIVEVPLVNRIFGAALGTLRKPAALFRAGFVKNEKDKNRPYSPRLPIETILLEKRPH